MSATVIVLDTNQFWDFPMLRSPDWMELIEKAPQWDLRFAVPEVCLLEAVADVPREWRKRRSEVAKLAVGEFGLTQSQNEWLDVIDRKIDGYEEALGARLADIEADIVPIPEGVNLRDIVQRAIDRRKPYQEGEGKKDGFRDTLIWYTTQHIAVADRDCEIWLVSTNHRDFGDKSQAVDHEACPYPLHPHLLEDLDTADLSGRVSYVRTLGRLVQHLAGKYDSQPESQREALISQLNQDKFEIALAASVDRFRLNPAAAALPLKAAYGVVHAFDRDVGSLEFVDVAMRGGGEWTAQFKQPIYATVDLTDHAAETSNVDKTLNVAGRLTVGANGHVRSMIVTSIEALPDDPMLRAWRMAWDPMSDTGFAQNIRQQIDPLSNPDILTRIRQQLDPLSNPNTAKRIHESPMRPPEPDEPQKLASPSLDELAANDVASPSGEDSDPDENNGTSPE